MHPSLSHDAITHGEQLFLTGHLYEALQVFDTVIANEPHNMLALNNKGVVLHGLGMYAEAAQLFAEILRQDDTNANAVFNLITNQLEQYQLQGAEEVFLQYGECLEAQDIQALKEKLYAMQDSLALATPAEQIKMVNISIEVNTKKHVLQFYLNEKEPAQRVICERFAQNALYRPGLSHFFASVLQQHDCVIDIGAHVGYFALLGAMLVGSHGTVVAIRLYRK